ncbi:MAG: DUF1553 domain-containing protein [Pirellulales bacterium]
MIERTSRLWALLLVFSLSGAVSAAELVKIEQTADPAALPTRISVFPATLEVSQPGEPRQIAVTGHLADGTEIDLTSAAELSSSDPAIAMVDGRRVVAHANGAAQITVEAAGNELVVPANIKGQELPERVSFEYGALVALSKQGCNSGACHGSPSGKGGFRLSLRAYDPVLDQHTLIREEYGRRTNPADPASSLLLRKPLMEVAHGGGQKLRKTDPAHKLLIDWIAQGCQLDPADSAKCVKLEIFPRQRAFYAPNWSQQMLALAHFSDGTVRDVTPLVIYSSSDESVAKVDESGLVVAQDKGEAAILFRYLDKMESARLTFLKPDASFQWPSPPANNYIDELVDRKLQLLQLAPSPLSTDDEFCRRVHLDVLGVLPTPEESASFVADTSPDKRSKLIDRLLERPEYASFWALKWGDLLRLNNKQLTAAGVPKFHRWLVTTLRDNMPYDQFVRELLTSTGSTFANPPANYFRAAADTNDCTETTAQVFLGIRIQCAKCHNHPFERWTQDNYYGIGAFFNRVSRKPSPKGDELVVFVSRSGEVTQPRTGKQMKPWLPLQGEAEMAGEDDRRQALAEWLSSPKNPFLAKAEVNRLWAHLMGRGIVEPVDDFRESNPPSNDELLAALAEDFASHGFDRKRILRTMLNSRTYQQSYRSNDTNKLDSKYFSHARTRLLSAEQLLDAICQVTGVAESYAGVPAGTRATQLPSPDGNHAFLKVFGQPARETACQCERSNDTNLSQALQMINGPTVHGKLRDEQNRLRKLAAAGKSDAEIVGELFQAAYCRAPDETELATAVSHIAAQKDRLRGLEDVCWSVLNSKEFLFQH